MAENQNIEYKESWRDEYLKWCCGFANAQGGKIYIGCNDEGDVVGVKDSKKLMGDPNIANIFYLAGFIESWGRGIERICEACKNDNLPAPEFTINPGDIMVKFTAPQDRIVHGPGKVTERVTGRVTEKEHEVIELLQLDPGFTYQDLAVKLKLSRKTVSDRIKSLKEKGVLERVGSDTKGYWKINI